MTIDHIIEMNHRKKLSEVKGYLVLRWMDQGLTWDSSEWGYIEVVYFNSNQVWKPDLMKTNHVNELTVDFPAKVQQLVRVWADRSFSSDLKRFNVEWTPYLKFEVHHQYNLE